jgi:hypothetical protein
VGRLCGLAREILKLLGVLLEVFKHCPLANLCNYPL